MACARGSCSRCSRRALTRTTSGATCSAGATSSATRTSSAAAGLEAECRRPRREYQREPQHF